MQEVFEKIIAKLEEEKKDAERLFDGGSRIIGFQKSIEIVKQVEAEYKDGWIPCSERLPIGEEYKIRVNGEIFYKQMLAMAEDIDISHEIVFYDQEEGEWVDKNGFYVDVIAWQPLPEQYREER